MNKTTFLAKVKETHRDYESALAGLSEAQLLQPRTCGDWAVRDMVAHVTWYEKQMVAVLQERALVGSDLWNASLEARNAAIHAENLDRTAAEILVESDKIFTEMVSLMDALTDEDLLHASQFREMPADWIPWQVIASNTFEHYPEHTEAIRRAFPRQVP